MAGISANMLPTLLIALFTLLWPGNGVAQEKPVSLRDSVRVTWLERSGPRFTVYYTAADSNFIPQLQSWLNTGSVEVESFLPARFQSKFGVYVFPDRATLDKQWAADWGVPGFASQCWMVASGVAHRLDLLTPWVWKSAACEHDPADSTATRLLLVHELVHVFHGQHNPIPDFTGLDSIGWFLEGLAVLVSGQLDSARQADAMQLVNAGKTPAELRLFWSGNARYAISGSLVAFIHRQYGPEQFARLLPATTQGEILKILGTTEKELIQNWAASLAEL
ncbi:hypothetical protein ACFLQW_00070 [Candidatus Zixiibacteriota bacterium]